MSVEQKIDAVRSDIDIVVDQVGRLSENTAELHLVIREGVSELRIAIHAGFDE